MTDHKRELPGPDQRSYASLLLKGRVRKISPLVISGVAGGGVVLLVLWFGRLPWSRLLPAMNNNEGVASWVQAVGSIAAIIAVAAVAGMEGRRAARSLELAQRQQKDAWDREEARAVAKRKSARAYTKAILDGSISRCEMIFEAVKGHESSFKALAKVYARDLEFLQDQLAETPKYLIEDAQLVNPVIRISLLIGDVLDGVRDLERYACAEDDLENERIVCAKTLELIPKRIATMKQWAAQVHEVVG